MNKYISWLLIFFMSVSCNSFSQIKKPKSFINWHELPALPDSFGFAGSFAGVSNGTLIVAGGANFPDGGAPWTGSKKVWSDKIFVLDKENSKWKIAGKLPQPLGYGVSVTFNDRMICVGGSNANGHYSSVFSISYNGKNLSITALPELPQALANLSGALLGNTIYIAGGLSSPDATSTSKIFWSLDLSARGSYNKWKALEPWPGSPRMLAVTGIQHGSFFLFSGTDLEIIKSGSATRKYLTDAYKFTPGKGWIKLADLPHAVVAAPTPAYTFKHSGLMIFGGDDGSLASEASTLKEKHPGFSSDILYYDVIKDKWSFYAKIKTLKKADAEKNPNGSIWAPVTTSLVIWNSHLIFPGGEVRPAVRTPRVLIGIPMGE